MLYRRHSSRANRRRPLVLLLGLLPLLALTTLSCGEGDKPNPAASYLSPAVQSQLEAALDKALAKNIPGVVAGIWLPGESWVMAKGKGDIASGTAIASGDQFRIAGVTKSFVATVALQLVDEGKLGLDEPLEEFIPGIANGKEITLRQLLQMNSGIASLGGSGGFNTLLMQDPLQQQSPAQLIEAIKQLPPAFAPGQRWERSDSNYILLGAVIEAVGGIKIEDQVARRVIEPLGLKHTSFPTTPDLSGAYAHGYTALAGQELTDVSRTNPSVSWAAGAMVSNLDDLRLWAEALAKGKLFSSQAKQAQQSWIPVPGQEALDAKYGLGVLSLAGMIGHTGSILGYDCVMFYDPVKQATIVVAVNKSVSGYSDSLDIFAEMLKAVFPEKFRR